MAAFASSLGLGLVVLIATASCGKARSHSPDVVPATTSSATFGETETTNAIADVVGPGPELDPRAPRYCDAAFPAAGTRFTDAVKLEIISIHRFAKGAAGVWTFTPRNEERRITYEMLELDRAGAPAVVRVIDDTYGARDLHVGVSVDEEKKEPTIVSEPTGAVPGIAPTQAQSAVVSDHDRFVIVDGGISKAIEAELKQENEHAFVRGGKRLPKLEAVLARTLTALISSEGPPHVEVRWVRNVRNVRDKGIASTASSTHSIGDEVFSVVARGTLAEHATCHGGYTSSDLAGELTVRSEDGMLRALALRGSAALSESMCPHTSRKQVGTAMVNVQITRECPSGR